jgi:hypothetical protein
MLRSGAVRTACGAAGLQILALGALGSKPSFEVGEHIDAEIVRSPFQRKNLRIRTHKLNESVSRATHAYLAWAGMWRPGDSTGHAPSGVAFSCIAEGNSVIVSSVRGAIPYAESRYAQLVATPRLGALPFLRVEQCSVSC